MILITNTPVTDKVCGPLVSNVKTFTNTFTKLHNKFFWYLMNTFPKHILHDQMNSFDSSEIESTVPAKLHSCS